MQLKYLDLDGLTSFYNQFTDKVTELVTAEVEEAGSALESSLQGWVNAKLGVASGIATLDANKKLTASQLPDITFPDYTNIYVALGATNQTVQGNKTFSGTTTFGSSLTISNAGITKIGSGTVNIGSSSAPINNIYATTFTGSLSGNATTATTATKLGTTDIGNNMTPMYLADGVPTAMSYTIQKSVPANAIFTDTVYTLTAANNTTLGGIKTGYSGTEEKRYAIKVDSNGNAYVDVNWTDTNTTYTLSSFGITVTSEEINYLSGLTSNVKTQLDTINTSLNGKINSTEKGTANCVANLDQNGHIHSSQLHSSVDEIVEITDLSGTGESGKIYVNTTDNKTYRWSGSSFVEISASLALGETSTTAYYGDKGKAAYDHSQITSGNPHGTTADQVGAPSKDGTGATGTWGISISGNAATATTATTATSAGNIGSKTVTLTGDVTGSATWDTSGNLSLDTTIAQASSGDVTVNKYYWHTEFTASTSSVTISTWSHYKDLNPDVEVYFNGFLLFLIGSDGVGEYSFDSETGTITFPNALGGNSTQQQIVVVIRTYNKPAVVIQKVATPVITIVS